MLRSLRPVAFQSACAQRVATHKFRKAPFRSVTKASISSKATGSSAGMVVLEGPPAVSQWIEGMNKTYEQKHLCFEDNFWSTKMGLKGASTDALAQTKTDYESFLADPANLAAVREKLAVEGVTAEQRHVLNIMEKTFKVNIIEDPRAATLKEKLNKLEAELGEHRGSMALGYKDPVSGAFRKVSSVQLSNTMKTSEDEATRKSCWEGLRSVGPHILEKFCAVVKLRNQLARLAGFEDFYDYKVQGAEGFSKTRLFDIMDGLEERSRSSMEAARAKLAAEKGAAALEPWNMSQALSGDIEKEADPYYPFEEAVDVWARTFAALGITYKGSVMRLDLCDREGKYSNGFCHWPQCAWRKVDGSWQPASANFTSLATPNAIGSGKTALATLLHEGGHAAHFANIDQHSPFFSQERAPTSVAYAENQSMFLDSLISDGDWLARYAKSRDGSVIPWALVEKSIRATHDYEVFFLRSMLAVPYFEKALYELPEERVTPAELQALADDVEHRIQGGLAGRPLLAVPHILADESSAYYHGYVLAEMSVHQTRQYFISKYGSITDNPEVGKQLTQAYWAPGNGAAFLDLVEGFTGAPLTGDAWVAALEESTEDKVSKHKSGYEAALKLGPKIPAGEEPELGMRVQLVHGDEVIADSSTLGGLAAACATFKSWVRQEYFQDAATSA